MPQARVEVEQRVKFLSLFLIAAILLAGAVFAGPDSIAADKLDGPVKVAITVRVTSLGQGRPAPHTLRAVTLPRARKNAKLVTEIVHTRRMKQGHWGHWGGRC